MFALGEDLPERERQWSEWGRVKQVGGPLPRSGGGGGRREAAFCFFFFMFFTKGCGLERGQSHQQGKLVNGSKSTGEQAAGGGRREGGGGKQGREGEN